MGNLIRVAVEERHGGWWRLGGRRIQNRFRTFAAVFNGATTGKRDDRTNCVSWSVSEVRWVGSPVKVAGCTCSCGTEAPVSIRTCNPERGKQLRTT